MTGVANSKTTIATAINTASGLRFFIIPAPEDEEAGRMYQKTAL